MKTTVTIVALLSLAAIACGEEGVDDVALHYPPALSAFAQSNHLTEQRQQAFVQIKNGEKRYTVAAYSNGHNGAIVLMESVGEGHLRVDQTLMGGFDGFKPEVTATDLDGDGKPEVIVSFLLDRGAETSIYRIRNATLERISPVTASGGPALVYPTLVDLGGKGAMDLVESTVGGPRDDRSVRYDHYALRDGKYAAVTPLDFYQVFYRQPRGARPETALFSISPSLVGKHFIMTILNGSDSNEEKFRLNKAVVTLNGVKVSAAEFSKHRSSWSLPVTLQEEDTIRVEFCANGEGGEEDHDCADLGRIAIAIHH